jgi:Flp pilus assembly protein TadG
MKCLRNRVMFGRGSPVERLGERGVAAVEFALIAMFFFTLVMGTIEFSMTMFDMNGANYGTRSEARLASNREWGTDVSCESKLDAASALQANVALNKVICATKQKAKLASSRVRVRVRFEDPDDPTALVNKPEVGKSLVICTMTTTRSLTGMFSPLLKGRYLSSMARSRIETDLSGELVAGSEEPFSPTGFDFCNPKAIGSGVTAGWAIAPAATTASCSAQWTFNGETPSASVALTSYNLEQRMSNLTNNTWDSYEVSFVLPAGHTPRAYSALGSVSGGGGQPWVFTKSVGRTGVPLAEGAVGAGIGVSVVVAPSAPSKSKPPLSALNATVTKINGVALSPSPAVCL